MIETKRAHCSPYKRFEAKQTHCGQYKRYGDFYRVWEICTNERYNDVLKYCQENLYKREIPERDEWHKNVCYGGEKFSDKDYYFAGWYSLKKNDFGYVFTVCEPYAD